MWAFVFGLMFELPHDAWAKVVRPIPLLYQTSHPLSDRTELGIFFQPKVSDFNCISSMTCDMPVNSMSLRFGCHLGVRETRTPIVKIGTAMLISPPLVSTHA